VKICDFGKIEWQGRFSAKAFKKIFQNFRTIRWQIREKVTFFCQKSLKMARFQ
jgi:hypothetical protein